MPDDTQSFLEEYTAEVSAHIGETITVNLTIVDALALVGQIQLAMRHPGNTGDSIKVCAGHFVRRIQKEIANRGLKTCAAVIEMGFDPHHDI